jgi:hypothetical protein
VFGFLTDALFLLDTEERVLVTFSRVLFDGVTLLERVVLVGVVVLVVERGVTTLVLRVVLVLVGVVALVDLVERVVVADSELLVVPRVVLAVLVLLVEALLSKRVALVLDNSAFLVETVLCTLRSLLVLGVCA